MGIISGQSLINFMYPPHSFSELYSNLSCPGGQSLKSNGINISPSYLTNEVLNSGHILTVREKFKSCLFHLESFLGAKKRKKLGRREDRKASVWGNVSAPLRTIILMHFEFSSVMILEFSL